MEITDERPGFLAFIVSGKGAVKTFANEAGGHRWQRIPPTEKRGRVHTSTVTVAVLPLRDVGVGLNPEDVSIATTRGSGPGGQHRNTTESCVIATHRPTGLTARIDLRSQHRSREVALQVLATRLGEAQNGQRRRRENDTRREQVGSGMRGDKIRTYREQDDQVADHRTGQKWRLARWQRGEWAENK